MANIIKHFQTISKHEASLRQSPATIECLVSVLNYIKSVLDDDSTTTLFNMISHHINTKGKTAHYLNLELLSEQLIDTIRKAFIALGLYTNEKIADQQYLYFFRDIYDGRERFNDTRFLQISSLYDSDDIIPMGYNDFVKWLVNNPEIYISEIPDDYDAIRVGLTLRLAKEWFNTYHNELINAHSNSLTEKLDRLFAICTVLPAYWLDANSFESSIYKVLGTDTYDKLMSIVEARLIAMGSPLTIDYKTYADTAESLTLVGYDQATMMADLFIREFYPSVENNVGTELVQFDLSSLEALYEGGVDSFVGYIDMLADCGETDGKLYERKYSDYYYPDHLKFVLSDTMTPEYKTTLTNLRSNVNKNYSKLYNVYSMLNRNNFSVYVGMSLSHLVEERTLDIINVTGLAKSIACISLIPYRDIYNNLFNKLVVSFDNYNPDFTVTLLDGIVLNDINHLDVVISSSRNTLEVHYTINDYYYKASFANVGRMFNVDPFFLYVIPRVAPYLKGTNRITGIKLFGKCLSNDDAIASVAGFNQV